ncbi:phage tail domain-containing protein [Cytobacillus gottheilii]|uniref:phage tail domain-containing protein n=1 Tax=Cytobacillus gottheilii TaxID=859144 RepID=UPI0009B9A827|nr:phage tail domain-containing protein [Cytobacillus gottheilii]
MIKESLYFSFANRKSTDFGIYNVSITGGLFDESITAAKSVNERIVRGNPIPYFIDTTEEAVPFQLHFSFLETWNDNQIDEVIRWLNVGYYEPLSFSENIDRVFYAMPIDSIQLIHNGLKQGYLTLNMKCDSPRSYSRDKVTPLYEVRGSKKVEIKNLGHYSLFPEIWINKIGDGDIEIINYSNGGRSTKFTNLKDNENLYMDCINERIETNIPDVFRHDDFNDEVLELPYGRNRLLVKGNANIKFGYRFIFT